MKRYPQSPAVLPVIHVESLDQALRNVDVCLEGSADGFFLINHSITDDDLLTIAESIAQKYPDAWLGVNCLGMSPQEMLGRVTTDIDAVWVDNAGIDENVNYDQQQYATGVKTFQERHAPHCLYFGGVAFKYQRTVTDLETACQYAYSLVDVITTSGHGTGRAADLEKMIRMRVGAGDAKIAVASGITPENVTSYLDYVDYFMVATGISKSFTELDPVKLKELVKRVRHG